MGDETGCAYRAGSGRYVCRHYEYNNLETAKQHLLTSQALGELAGYRKTRIAGARRWRASGRPTMTWMTPLDLLEQAERLYHDNFSPNAYPIATRKIRVWVAQGRLGEVLAWARKQRLSVDNELSYLREFDHITLALA